MTLSFSSFSIKDILTGRGDVRGKPGTGRTEELDACTGQTTVPGDEDNISQERLPAELSVSAGNLRSDEEPELREGEQTLRIHTVGSI